VKMATTGRLCSSNGYMGDFRFQEEVEAAAKMLLPILSI
jgi:hypothetical protein